MLWVKKILGRLSLEIPVISGRDVIYRPLLFRTTITKDDPESSCLHKILIKGPATDIVSQFWAREFTIVSNDQIDINPVWVDTVAKANSFFHNCKSPKISTARQDTFDCSKTTCPYGWASCCETFIDARVKFPSLKSHFRISMCDHPKHDWIVPDMGDPWRVSDRLESEQAALGSQGSPPSHKSDVTSKTHQS